MSSESDSDFGTARPLTRTSFVTGEAPPVRIVHIGLGAFHRAHQAWYTAQMDKSRDWGIAAFTGRDAAAAERLSAQDGLYTLVTRGPDGDRFEVVTSIVEAHDGADLDWLTHHIAGAATAIISLTITEAGYRLRESKKGPQLDTEDNIVAADLQALRSHFRDGTFQLGPGGLTGDEIRSTAARLVVGFAVRRAVGSGPLAVVACDNLPGNGTAAQVAVVETAHQVDRSLAAWILEHVSFVDTSIDRITPKTTQEDRETVARDTGWADEMPVVTEPFSSWVLSGDFPAGRPRWEEAGAVVVNDLEPFERRKLWMLNSAHSLLAYAGQIRGHATVAEAISDAQVSEWVEELWDAAASHFQDPVLEITEYREALRQRFDNPRIAHHLKQIGVDGSLKLAVRAVPILRAEQAKDRDGTAALRMMAAWMDHVCTQISSGQHLQDAAAEHVESAVADTASQTSALLTVIHPSLADDPELVDRVQSLRGTFTT